MNASLNDALDAASKPSVSAREALIAELIGDLGEVLGDAQTLLPTMNASRQALVEAHQQLSKQLSAHVIAFDAQLDAMFERARLDTAKMIAANAHAVVKRSVEDLSQAMRGAAEALFNEQVSVSIQRLAEASQRLAEQQSSARERWVILLSMMGTAFMAGICLALWLWGH